MPSSYRLILPVVLLVLGMSAPASATTFTFDGSGDWSDAGNWSPAGGPPGPNDTAVVGTGTLTVSDARSVGSLTLTGGATREGTGLLTVTGTATIANGNLNGPTTFGPSSTVALDCQCGIGSTVTFQGTTSYASGTLFTSTGTALVNSGTFTHNGGGTTSGGTFTNQAGGIYRRTASTGSSGVAMPVTNNGTIDAQAGTLALGSVSGDGDLTVAETAVLRGTFSLGAGGTATGDGTLWWQDGSAADGATIDVDALILDGTVALETVTPAASAKSLDLSAGTRVGAGTLLVSDVGIIANGNFEDGVTTFGPASTVTLDCQCGVGGDAVVNFNGTTSRVGGTWFHSGTAVIRNGGVFTLGSNGGWGSFAASGASFDNAGTLIRTPGTTGSNLPITSSGTIEVQGGGTLGGDITLTNGILKGAGALSGHVTNSGAEVQPGASIGRLTIGGDYTQTAGTLEVEMQGTAPGEFDVLAVSTAVTIGGGTLEILRLNNFTPAISDEFRFIESGFQPTGSFSTISAASVGDHGFKTRNDASPPGVVAFLALNPPSGGQPSIPVSAVVGDTLTCQPGTWSPAPTSLAYEWRRDGATVVGTAAQYTATPDDAGHTLTCRVTATGTGGSTAATSNAAAISKRPQSITFPAPGDKTVGDADFDPGATAASGLPVAYQSTTPGVCTIVAGKVHLVAAGTCTITALQHGDGTWAAATEVTRSLAVAAAATPQQPSTPTESTKPTAVPIQQIAVLPSKRKCVSRRNFRIHFRTPKGEKLARAVVVVNGKRVAVRKGNRLSAPVDLRGLPKGRFTVRITVRMVSGKVLRGTRRYRTCAPKRRS